MHWMLYDLSDAQRGKPFEIVAVLPSDVGSEAGSQLKYRLCDMSGKTLLNGKVPLSAAKGHTIEVPIKVEKEVAQTIYLRGRFRLLLFVEDGGGKPVYSGIRELDHLLFKKRDDSALAELPEQFEETPYGKLKLIDHIDCSKSIFDEEHPYMQSSFEGFQSKTLPGSNVQQPVS